MSTIRTNNIEKRKKIIQCERCGTEFKNLRNFHNYQITMAKKHNKEIDKIYKFYLGRIFFDNKKIISRSLNFDRTKISALSQKTNKNKIEINILILNSIIQNDFVSAFCFIFNNKKLTSKNLKEVLSKNQGKSP